MYLKGIVRHVPESHFTRGPRSPPVLGCPESASVFNSLPPPPSSTEASRTFPSPAKFRPFPVLRVATRPPKPPASRSSHRSWHARTR
jgi:hypothetical protein